jgi:enolase
MIALLREWTTTFPLRSIEDPLFEDDWEGWKHATEVLGNNRMIVGDDLFVTSKARLEQGISKHAANAILIKPNQIGTVTETLATIRHAQEHQMPTIVSHRSGETPDTSLVDIAIGAQSPWIKAGAPARGERVAKYNRLLAWWESERE